MPPTPWSQPLSRLEQHGTIQGFALITAQGPVQPATGVFAQECQQGVSPALGALIQPFYEAIPPPTTHTLAGHKLHVVQQSDSCYVAIAKQRQLGLIALNTPLGVLLATFGRAAQPTVALAALQAACSEGLSCRQQQPQQGGAKQQPAPAAVGVRSCS